VLSGGLAPAPSDRRPKPSAAFNPTCRAPSQTSRPRDAVVDTQTGRRFRHALVRQGSGMCDHDDILNDSRAIDHGAPKHQIVDRGFWLAMESGSVPFNSRVACVCAAPGVYRPTTAVVGSARPSTSTTSRSMCRTRAPRAAVLSRRPEMRVAGSRPSRTTTPLLSQPPDRGEIWLPQLRKFLVDGTQPNLKKIGELC
jgi:hypothetical protein